MRVLAGLVVAASLLFAANTLDVFGYKWSVRNPADWKVDKDGGAQVLHLVTPREPLPGPRRPIQFAIAETKDYGDVMLEADVRPHDRSLMIVFCYRDPAHFDYAHLSIDTGVKESHHNGIFHVYDGERVRISSPQGPAAFPASGRWYHVQLTHSAKSGAVQVSVDGRAIPALHAVDLSLTSGKVGLGSFDETGDFKNVRISGSSPTK
jgi:hypothetical protein